MGTMHVFTEVLLWLLCMGCLVNSKKWVGEPLSEEYRLLHDLLKDYDTTVRPRFNSSEPVTVLVRFSLQQIYDLDEKRQILTISGWITAEWRDEYLQWNPDEYGGLQSIVLSPRAMWVPKLALGNSADRMFQDWRHFLITVFHNGNSRWQPGGNFAFTCALDMDFYPFDEQICTMQLETWYYSSGKMNLNRSMAHLGLETFVPHGEWAIISTSVTRVNRVDGYYEDEKFPEIFFSLALRRKYTFYFMYILIPCIMLSLVLLMVFVLPAQSGEKINLGISIMVAFSVFLLIVAEKVPDTSDSVPVIAIYLMYYMMTTTLAVMTSTLVLSLHYRGAAYPAPHWLRILAFDLIGPVLCLHSITAWNRLHRHCHHIPAHTDHTDLGDEMYAHIHAKDEDTCTTEPELLHGLTQQNGNCRGQPAKTGSELRQSVSLLSRTLSLELVPADNESDDDKEAGAPMNDTCCCHGNDTADKADDDICHLSYFDFIGIEWVKISEVADRLFLVLFFFFVLIPLVSLLAFTRVFEKDEEQ